MTSSNATPDDFDQETLVEQIVEAIEDQSLIVDGDEWWVDRTADPFEFTVSTHADVQTVTRRLLVRLSATVTEVAL